MASGMLLSKVSASEVAVDPVVVATTNAELIANAADATVAVEVEILRTVAPVKDAKAVRVAKFIACAAAALVAIEDGIVIVQAVSIARTAVPVVNKRAAVASPVLVA
jgi:hypothetical protein